MSDTPRSDDFIGPITGIYMTEGEIAICDFARQLERELNAAKAELAELKKVIRKIYYETETCADGAPDATDHDKLCNEIACELKPFIR
jgi:hypothetical protein